MAAFQTGEKDGIFDAIGDRRRQKEINLEYAGEIRLYCTLEVWTYSVSKY